MLLFFFFKQKTAYEMRISDWSSDVCSSDLHQRRTGSAVRAYGRVADPTRIDAWRLRARRGIPCALPGLDQYPVGAQGRAARTPDQRPSGHAGAAPGAWLMTRFVSLMCAQVGRASCRARVCQYV